MKSFQTPDGWMLRLDPGEEVLSKINEFCHQKGMYGTISGIGAVNQVKLRFFNPGIKGYEFKKINEPLELISLEGNVSIKDGKTFSHVHAVFGKRDYSVIGGHLSEATVSVTAEIRIIGMPAILRVPDEKTGLKLLGEKHE